METFGFFFLTRLSARPAGETRPPEPETLALLPGTTSRRSRRVEPQNKKSKHLRDGRCESFFLPQCDSRQVPTLRGSALQPPEFKRSASTIHHPASSFQQDKKACPKPDPGSCSEKGDPWILEACHPFMSSTPECRPLQMCRELVVD